jgi:outer membrane protein OmpA-like peptidoglycan-associated protein
MRRIIHNTTAIAACLSLMAPHLAMAQTAAVEGEAQQQQPEVLPPEAEQQPEGSEDPLADALAQQEEAGAEGDGAAGQAEADAAPVEDPAEEAQPAEDAVDESAMDAQPEPAAEPMAEEQDATEQPAAEPADAASDAPSAEGAAGDMADDDMTAGDAAPEDDAAAETSDAAEPVGDPLAEALEAEQADVPEDANEEQAEEAQPAEEMPDETAGSEPAAEEAETDQDPLAEALAAEQQASEAEDGDAATSDDAQADVDQPAEDMTDEAADTEGEAATDQDALAEALEQEQSGAEGAVQDAEATEESAEAPEADAKETEAAKEAAEASEAPKAAALDDDASSDGEITQEQVTEDNSRSSAEDFATSLSEALGGATGQPEAEARSREDDDDDDNDLTKALLLGAGALAVGAMLNNNRQVSLSTPDRVVVTRPDGSQQVIKDEVALLRQPGSTVATENFDDGSSRTIVTRQDGSKVVTIRDADLRVLRRTLVSADGTTTRLIDDTSAQPVDIASLPAPAAASNGTAGEMNEDQLREALRREANVDRRFSLAQIRDIPQVRALVAPVAVSGITFDTGSAAISPDQAKQLSALGNALRESIAENSGEVFLIEGHTDTVGSDAANLALSDRRAESVALALTEYFDVPPENMVVQGYGEQYLQVRREGDVRQNRRASVRRITDLLQQASAD